MTDNDSSLIADNASKLLQGILERMDIAAEIDVSETDDKIILDIRCRNAERVIGRRGQVIDALQHIVGKASYRDRTVPRGKPVVVDADGYRDRHIERLESLAERMGRKAIKTNTVIELNPMTAHDRRIIHMALAEMDGVSTRSEGEGMDRHVLVVPGDDAGDSAVAE